MLSPHQQRPDGECTIQMCVHKLPITQPSPQIKQLATIHPQLTFEVMGQIPAMLFTMPPEVNGVCRGPLPLATNRYAAPASRPRDVTIPDVPRHVVDYGRRLRPTNRTKILHHFTNKHSR
jgi:hypothetical protein